MRIGQRSRFPLNEPLADLLGECGDRRIQVVDMVNDLVGNNRMVGSKVTIECLLESRDLASHPGLGHLR